MILGWILVGLAFFAVAGVAVMFVLLSRAIRAETAIWQSRPNAARLAAEERVSLDYARGKISIAEYASAMSVLRSVAGLVVVGAAGESSPRSTERELARL
jgi:hypothetical protein